MFVHVVKLRPEMAKDSCGQSRIMVGRWSIMNVGANRAIGITCVIGNDVKGDIATLLLNECRDALKRNVDKKFMTPTYPGSDAEIPGEWTLATGYDVKSGPTWLDKGMVFSSVKELLEGIYSDVKKGTRFVVWIGFRVSDEDTLTIRESSVPTSTSASPVKKAPPKPRPVTQKTKIKKEPALSNNNRKVKKENPDAKPNVRASH
jgi:hypothetical protein